MRLGKGFGAWLVLCLAMPAQAAWHQVRTQHFIIYSEGAPERLRKFAVDLENFDQAARKALNYESGEGDNPNPVTVYVVDNFDAVKKLCRGGETTERDKAACRSVAFVPRNAGNGPMELDARTVLFHEYAHHLMMAHSTATYPAWYVEGFAEFISNVRIRTNEVGIGYPARSRSGELYAGAAMSVKDLLTANPSAFSPERRSTFYACSWLLTHFLTFSADRNKQLMAYLHAINRGKSSTDAAAEAFGDIDLLNKQVEAYLRGNRFGYLPITVTQPAPETIRMRQLSPGEAAMMPVRLQSQRSVDSQTARQVAAQARATAAAWPNDAGAQLILAEAEYDAGDAVAAEAAADRALVAEPAQRGAMVFKALARMRQAHEANRFDSATWRDIRSWLLKANKIEPNAAWPLMLYYRSFLDQGERPTPNAVAALQRSAELSPQDNEVRMMLVNQYLRDKELRAARVTLAPLAFNPHAPPGNPARRLFDRLDRDGLAAIEGPGAGLLDEPTLESSSEDQ